jgi:hypothetical protein
MLACTHPRARTDSRMGSNGREHRQLSMSELVANSVFGESGRSASARALCGRGCFVFERGCVRVRVSACACVCARRCGARSYHRASGSPSECLPTSAPGLASPLPRRPRVRQGPLLPHLHRDWAHPSRICAGTGIGPATSAPGLCVLCSAAMSSRWKSSACASRLLGPVPTRGRSNLRPHAHVGRVPT